MRSASRLAWHSGYSCSIHAVVAGTRRQAGDGAALSAAAFSSSSTAPHLKPAPPPSSEPTPPLITGLRLVALASVAGAAAVVLPNLSAQGAPHAVKLMGAETPTYRRTGASRAARLARSAPGGAASLAVAGAAGVLAPIIRGDDEAAAVDACAVGAALLGVAGVEGALESALAAAGEIVATVRGEEGPAVLAARDFLWAAKKQQRDGHVA